MTTHKAIFGYTSGQTLTAKVFLNTAPATVVATASSVSEITDDASGLTGAYRATFADLSAGNYTIRWYLGGTPAGYAFLKFSGTNGEEVLAADGKFDSSATAEIASGVRTNLTTELARIDAAISSRSSHSAADAANALNGVGAHTISLTIKLSAGTVVSECDCILTTTNTNANTNVYASARSNPSGIVNFDVDEGTYYLWRQKAGVNFTNPKTVTVDSNGTATVS